MIQRKQTLFLLMLVGMGVAFLLAPSITVKLNALTADVTLLPLNSLNFKSSPWHIMAIALNFIAIALGLITIFLFKKRILQVKLCYVLMLVELCITLLISLCPVVLQTEGLLIHNTGFGSLIGIIAMMCAYLAARLIKKDIELLKSADRIR